MSTTSAQSSGVRSAFTAALAEPGRPPIGLRTAVVVAHADDESIGCGALLQRLRHVTIVHVTDGAPRDPAYARSLGFEDDIALAAARRTELESAMAIAGAAPDILAGLGYRDQEASLHLTEIAEDLAGRLADAEIVLTHAYEGGHPDHDATAFAVHAACRALSSEGRQAPAIYEMPLYRVGPSGWAAQLFTPIPGCTEIVTRLLVREQEVKRRMLASHHSQRSILAAFTTEAEYFRAAPDYDFLELPNAGALVYEGQSWGMTGVRWLQYSRAALAALGQEVPP